MSQNYRAGSDIYVMANGTNIARWNARPAGLSTCHCDNTSWNLRFYICRSLQNTQCRQKLNCILNLTRSHQQY